MGHCLGAASRPMLP